MSFFVSLSCRINVQSIIILERYTLIEEFAFPGELLAQHAGLDCILELLTIKCALCNVHLIVHLEVLKLTADRQF
jgi:hypothetical protein